MCLSELRAAPTEDSGRSSGRTGHSSLGTCRPLLLPRPPGLNGVVIGRARRWRSGRRTGTRLQRKLSTETDSSPMTSSASGDRERGGGGPCILAATGCEPHQRGHSALCVPQGARPSDLEILASTGGRPIGEADGNDGAAAVDRRRRP